MMCEISWGVLEWDSVQNTLFVLKQANLKNLMKQ